VSFTRVVNVHHEHCDVWVGRPSIWGNPFHTKPGEDRLEVIERYKRWFCGRLRDPVFRAATTALRGKIIGCACVPKMCHAHIIAAWLNGEMTDTGEAAF